MSQSLSDFLKQYKWLTDEACYYNSFRQSPVAPATILEKLIKLGNPESKATEIMGTMKETGITKAQLKKPKANAQVFVTQSYEVLKPFLGLLREAKAGSDKLYAANELNQVTLCGDCEMDKFRSLIVASPKADKAVKLEFEEGQHATTYQTKFTHKTFVDSLYNCFIMDSSNLLHTPPAAISWSPLEPAFRVLDPAILKHGDTPNWDSFLSRMDYPEIFKAYVWSIFEPRNTGRQALWLKGEGSDGKSSAINALSAFLGRDYVLSISKGTYDETFFFGQAFGKRMAVYMDCKNTYILKSEKIKSLLGRDTVLINKKNQTEFSAQVYSKLLVASNFFPKINYNDNSERSRLLLCEVATFQDEFGDPDFEYNLEKEVPAFLLQCKEAYIAHCPNNVNLRVPKSMVHKIKAVCAAKESEIMMRFVDLFLDFSPKAKLLKIDVHEALAGYLGKYGIRQNASFLEEDFSRLLATKGIKQEIIDGSTYYLGIDNKKTDINYKLINGGKNVHEN
jgi:hypothetical protein